MSAPPKPDTTEETVDRLWYLIEGLNGDGMKSKVDKMFEWMVEQKTAQTIAQSAQSTAQGQLERRKMSAREWALIAATALPTFLLCYLTWILSHPQTVQAVAQAVKP